jgi:hypothetical protein
LVRRSPRPPRAGRRLLTNLHLRFEAGRRRLTIQGLAAHLCRAEDRVLLTLWLLGDSCGRVTPEGIVIPLSLTHEVLARLTAARRPTITLALRSLEAAGCIQTNSDGELTLTSAVQRTIEQLSNASNEAPSLGPQITFHTAGARADNGGPPANHSDGRAGLASAIAPVRAPT